MTENKKFSRFTAKHSEVWKFIKFSFAGVSSSVVQLALDAMFLYWVFASYKDIPVTNAFLLKLGAGDRLDVLLAYFASATLGYLMAFIMNRKLTFKSKTNPVLATVEYILMVVFTILATTWLKGWLYKAVANWGYESFIINTLIDIFVMLVPTVWTYPLQRYVIHRPSKEAEEQEKAAKDALAKEESEASAPKRANADKTEV